MFVEMLYVVNRCSFAKSTFTLAPLTFVVVASQYLFTLALPLFALVESFNLTRSNQGPNFFYRHNVTSSFNP
jgi:hypothetical protein